MSARHVVVVGAQRCGTSYLADLLDAHPAVTVATPRRPEPKVFLHDEVVERGAQWYADTWFPARGDATLLVEKSTSYLDHPVSGERIDRVLMTDLSIGPFEAARLRAEAEVLEAEAPDTVRFTRALKAATALEHRAALMRALWSVALADGLREAEEDRLMRLVANLLGLSDVENARARQMAERAMGRE